MTHAAIETVPHLIAGTMASTDLDASRRFYEEFLNFDCVRTAPDCMLIRARSDRKAMALRSHNFLVIEVLLVPEITRPQNILNHWGFAVDTVEEVDRIHQEAHALKGVYGIRRVNQTTNVHNAYGFYFSDRDMNWWEIECRLHGKTVADYFKVGDVVHG